jgi:hypothetical protein
MRRKMLGVKSAHVEHRFRIKVSTPEEKSKATLVSATEQRVSTNPPNDAGNIEAFSSVHRLLHCAGILSFGTVETRN